MALFGKKETNKDKAREDYVLTLRRAVDKIYESDENKKLRAEMDKYLREFKGEWWDKNELKEYESQVSMNFVFSTVMSIAPLLTDNRPVVTIRARQAFMQKLFDVYQLCNEYLWDKLEMDTKIFKLVTWALIAKIGYWKVWFDPKAEFGGEVSVTVLDPRTFFCAPGYDDLWEAPFMGTITKRPLSYIREHFPTTGRDVKPDTADKSVDYSKKASYELHSDDVTVYELWMRDDEIEEYLLEDEQGNPQLDDEGKEQKGSRKKYPYGKLVTFTKGLDLLDEKPSPYKHNKPPYVSFTDYFDPEKLEGISETQIIEPLNRSYNRALQLFDSWVKLYCDPNWTVDSKALGVSIETIKQQLPGGGNVWGVNSYTGDQNPIRRVEIGNLPNEVSQVIFMLPKMIEEITGQTDVSKGIPSKTQRQSAQEISTLIEASYTRTRQRVRNLEATLKRTAYLMVNLMQQYYTEPRQFSVQRDNTAQWFQVSSSKKQVDRMLQPQGQEPPENEQEKQEYDDYKAFLENFGDVDEVYADFDLTIDTNSTLPMDKQSLANLFIKLLQMGAVDPEAVLKQLRVPQADEIISRMQQRAMQMAQAKAGPQPMPGPQGQPPQDMTDRLGGSNVGPNG